MALNTSLVVHVTHVLVTHQKQSILLYRTELEYALQKHLSIKL